MQYLINKELQKIFDIQIAKFNLFEHFISLILLSLLLDKLEFFEYADLVLRYYNT